MPIPEVNDRRTVPRHLRDSEHETIATTSAAGARAEDAAQGRARSWALWLACVAVFAAVAWWWLD